MTSVPNVALQNKFFGGMSSVKGSKDGNYVRPGRYWMQIRALKAIVTAKMAETMIWEMVTIYVDPSTAAYSPALKNAKVPSAGTAPPHRVGEEVAWALQANQLSTRPNLKAALAAILYDGDEEKMNADATDQDLMVLFSTPCPIANMVVEVDANLITTRAGNPFTRVTFKREVPAEEVLATVPPETLNKFFPPNYFENLIAAQVAAAATK